MFENRYTCQKAANAMMNAVLTDKLPVVTQILRANNVTRAYAFGSVCTDRFTDRSDIDLLVAFDETLDPVTYGETYFALVDALELALQRPVDLVTERSLQNPHFIARLNKTKTAIYE